MRLVWVPLAAWVSGFLSASLRKRDPIPDRRALFLIGWVGLRGIVSLAGAMALPLTRTDGSLVPYRAELILLTFVVIFCTLVLQGSTLAPVVRLLRFPPDDEAAREEQRARSEAARSALARLQEISAESRADPTTLATLREPAIPPSSPSVFGRLGESIEIGASARDLRSRMDPESASQVAIRRNQAKVIRARFCWVHLQDRSGEAEFMAGEM